MSDRNNCEECISRAKLLFEQYKRSAEEEYKYTSLVFSLGYAAIVTIFSTVHKAIPLNLKGIFILFFAISLIAFVANEIWKMKLGQKDIENNNKIWDDFFNGKITLTDIEHKSAVCYNEFSKNYYDWYPKLFKISLYAGIFATLILFVYCICLIFI